MGGTAARRMAGGWQLEQEADQSLIWTSRRWHLWGRTLQQQREGEWPSVYVHRKLKLLLVVYVDDFKMAGPKANLSQGWELLRTKLGIEPETGLGLYNQIKGERMLDGKKVNTVTYDMEEYLEKPVKKSLGIVGHHVKLCQAQGC